MRHFRDLPRKQGSTPAFDTSWQLSAALPRCACYFKLDPNFDLIYSVLKLQLLYLDCYLLEN